MRKPGPRGACLAALAAVACVLVVLPASAGASARRHGSVQSGAHTGGSLCDFVDLVDNVHTLSDLPDLLSGDFGIKSLAILFGGWGASAWLCGGKELLAHNILLNAITSPFASSLRSTAVAHAAALPRVTGLPVSVSFPTVQLARNASGRNVAGDLVPLSIRWIQLGAVDRVDFSFQEDNQRCCYLAKNVRTVGSRTLLRQVPVAWTFPANHRYSLCIVVHSGFRFANSCASGYPVSFYVGSAVPGFSARYKLDHGEWAPLSYPEDNQVGVIGSSGRDEFEVDDTQAVAGGCVYSCLAFSTPFLAPGNHTLWLQDLYGPLTLQRVVWLKP
jgi:hypothetical protein